MILHRAVAQLLPPDPVAGEVGAVEWNARHKAPYGLLLSASEPSAVPFVWTDMPNSVTAYPVTATNKLWVQAGMALGYVRQVRLIVNVAVAGAAGSWMFGAATWWDFASSARVTRGLAGFGIAKPGVFVDTVGLKDSGWVDTDGAMRGFDPENPVSPPLPAGELPFHRVQILGISGNSVNDPEFGSIFLYGR